MAAACLLKLCRMSYSLTYLEAICPLEKTILQALRDKELQIALFECLKHFVEEIL